MKSASIKYRKPSATDGFTINQLISQCPPLDLNSVYCNLLQCSDFADTSIIAEGDTGEIAGFISGYIPPQRQDTLFIWQVALHPDWRGQGIALQMLLNLFDRQQNVSRLETTISPGNTASENLFKRFFEQRQMQVSTQVLFSSAEHFAGQHEDEVLYRGSQATA